MTWDRIPEPLLVDCGQLVKANSIEGGTNLVTCDSTDLMTRIIREQEG